MVDEQTDPQGARGGNKMSGWISASTPPDDGETVIIHTLGGEVWTGFIDGKVWRNVAGARIHDEEPVLHWMPLPLPPEDEA